MFIVTKPALHKTVFRKTLFIACLTFISIFTCLEASAEKPESPAFSKKTLHVPGYVVHGINNYNGEHIVDFSQVSPSIPYLSAYPPVDEIGVYQDGLDTSGTIFSDTSRTRKVATTRSFFDYFNPGGDLDLDTINITLDQVGTNFLGTDFTSLDKRIVPPLFKDAGDTPTIHRKRGVNASPTVGEWEQISGKMTVLSSANGSSVIKITIRDAFPNAVYTLWDLGATNPLTAQESGYAVPLGGIPNIVTTDAKGCGFARVKLNYDITQACVPGAAFCSSYVSAFYNWDAQALGASAGATWAKAPTGIYGGNQIIWPMSGDVLIDPPTHFVPKKHGCDIPSNHD